MPIKCHKCNHENPDDTLFCGRCGTQLPSPEDIEVTETIEAPKEELTRGTTFAGRYEIIEELGKGGMGRVYRVEDTKLEQEVALKLIKPEIAKDKKTIERFRNELKLARNIRHKNVCGMFDLGEERGAHFITMEYVRGEDLRSSIRRFGQLPIGKSISIATQICEGLAEAHRLGVVHRDLKSNNIMIDKEGNVRIMDFGIARSLEAKGITGAGVMIGTPEYMSPEQAEAKEFDQRSDIYSLGVILYEMVTGRVPFEGDTALSIAMKHKSEAPTNPKEYNAQIPDDLTKLILKCLEKDKGNRHQSAGELYSELNNIEKGIPTADRVIPKRKPITSKEITVTFGLRKLIIPALVVVALVIIGVIIWQLLPKEDVALSEPVKPSIAVLPFEDLSPEKDQEYLCVGLAESIINALTNIKNLRVPARTSSFSFKEKGGDVREIGNKLDVKTVLEGSVQKSGDRLRVTAQLVNVSDESLLWSDQFNRKMEDVFAIQDEITQAIVTKLRVNLLGEERVDLVKRHTNNPQAYEAYLKGRYYWNKRTAEAMTDSIEYFKQAIEIDPAYALAYAGMADTYIVLGEWNIYAPNDVFPKAKAAALKALEINDKLGEIHITLASIKRDYEWDWEGAEREYKQGIELSPNYATGHQWYAGYLSCMGRHDEAVAEIKHAQEIDPLSPIIFVEGAYIFFDSSHYDQSIEQCKKALALDSNYIGAHLWLTRNYIKKDLYEKAVDEIKIIESLAGEEILFEAAMLYASMENRREAIQIIDDLIMKSDQEYVDSYSLAVIYCLLNDKEQAFSWLERAYKERSYGMTFLKVRPYCNMLRSDPRFSELLKKMNLD